MLLHFIIIHVTQFAPACMHVCKSGYVRVCYPNMQKSTDTYQIRTNFIFKTSFLASITFHIYLIFSLHIYFSSAKISKFLHDMLWVRYTLRIEKSAHETHQRIDSFCFVFAASFFLSTERKKTSRKRHTNKHAKIEWQKQNRISPHKTKKHREKKLKQNEIKQIQQMNSVDVRMWLNVKLNI